MKIALVLLILTAVAAPAYTIESGVFQMKEDYGTEPLADGALQYYYYIPCPTYSWFEAFYDWEPGDIVGKWFHFGDQGTGGYDPLDELNCRHVEQIRILDFAGYGGSYPGLYTVEFKIHSADPTGCPLSLLWTSDPIETAFGWNDIYVVPPVPIPDGYNCLITAEHIGSDARYPKWGCDFISNSVLYGCNMHDFGCLPATYPRTTIHSGYYGNGGFENCPPEIFRDPADTTVDCSQYGPLELAWRVTVGCYGSGDRCQIDSVQALYSYPGGGCVDTLDLLGEVESYNSSAIYPIVGLTVVDSLPDGVEYISSWGTCVAPSCGCVSSAGTYDPGPPATVTWNPDTLCCGSPGNGFYTTVTVRLRRAFFDCGPETFWHSIKAYVDGELSREGWGSVPVERCPRAWHIAADGSGDAPTIEAGINSACAGDTVLVAFGTYYEHDIDMKSGVALVSETGEADCVTIDAQGLGRVFECSGLDSTTSIDGFTITGGLIDDHGGAMEIDNSSFTVRRCVISGNSTVGAGHSGGAIRCRSSSPVFRDCVISGNTAAEDGGGAYCHDSSSPVFENCIFAGNVSPERGGGLACFQYSEAVLTNCTFYGNSGVEGGGISSSGHSDLAASNTIVSFSTVGSAAYCGLVSGTITLTCCDVYGNSGGDWTNCISSQEGQNGNFGADPQFCDTLTGDFHLEETSPCAPAQQPTCGLIGALGPGCYAGVPEWVDTHGGEAAFLSVGPNPSRAGTRIAYQVAGEQGKAQRVLLRVFDASGRHVRTLVDKPKLPGSHMVDWNGLDSHGISMPPGIYFCRYETAGHMLTEKVVLLK